MASDTAKAGTYELVAASWRQPVKVVDGQLVDWEDHKRGDPVELDAKEADRLLRAGAVKALDDEHDKSAAAQEGRDRVRRQEESRKPAQVPAEEGKTVEATAVGHAAQPK